MSDTKTPEPPILTSNVEPPVGYFEIVAGVRYASTRRPIWLHRIMARALLGWRWVDL